MTLSRRLSPDGHRLTRTILRRTFSPWLRLRHPATQSLDLTDPDVLASLSEAIGYHETGSRYDKSVYQAGVGRALGGGITPKSPPVSANVFDALTEGLKAKPKVALERTFRALLV
ncbi:hypothetical protein [Enterobacter phage 03_vB_Eclo_IJM]|nr:hypothetical protein [Enterobacter phage 03_vB_Eclo_IJM]